MAERINKPWHIIHSESENGWGGQEHRILTELIGFQGRGCKVQLLTPSGSKLWNRAEKANIALRDLQAVKSRYPITILKTALWLKKQKVDVLNTHSSRDGWILGVAGRLAGIPLIVRTRHIDVSYPNKFVSRHAFTTFADHVLTTSQKITNHFQEIFKLPDDRITTVPTGIDLTKFNPVGEKAVLLPPSEPQNIPVIGMVCVLRSWKGHPTFLEAAKLLKESGVQARYILAGENTLDPRLNQHIHNLGLDGHVFCLGFREDVPAILRALSILVIPSTDHEGVPQIGLQGLATKTPIVGSDVGGIPEIVRDGKCGRIFPRKNAAALAEAIRQTLADKATTEKYTAQGLEDVKNHHSVDFMLDTLDAIYSRYLKK